VANPATDKDRASERRVMVGMQQQNRKVSSHCVMAVSEKASLDFAATSLSDRQTKKTDMIRATSFSKVSAWLPLRSAMIGSDDHNDKKSLVRPLYSLVSCYLAIHIATMSVGVAQGTDEDEYSAKESVLKSKRIPIDTETIRLYLSSVYVLLLSHYEYSSFLCFILSHVSHLCIL